MLALLWLIACSDISLTPVPDTDLDTDVKIVYVDTDIDSDIYIYSTVEVFEYFPPPEAVDIVLVLDGSGSMANNWDSIYLQIPTMARALEDLNIDWRFTAVSADSRVNLGITGYSTPFTSSIEWDLYASLLNIQALNGISEAGLDASVATAANPANSTFFRADADLLWIFLSDEEDQSNIATAAWVNVWQYFKSSGPEILATSIVATSQNACFESPGLRYIEVSQTVVGICEGEGDWSTIFAPIENRLIHADLIYTLTGKPIENTIQVWVGINPSLDWTYDVIANTITLTKEPDRRTDIVVHYFPE